MEMDVWTRDRIYYRNDLETFYYKRFLKRIFQNIFYTIIISVLFSTILVSVSAAEIWTTDEFGINKTDFSPGDIVYIHGKDFLPSSIISINVTRPDNTTNQSFTISNGTGDFIDEYDLDGITGEYNVIASDGINTAETTFTDAAIWTTRDDCGDQTKDVNHYAIGDHVFINGDNFDPDTYDWSITGKPGGASCDPNIVVASGMYTVNASGLFCFDAYTVQPDDCGEYQVKFGKKGDNYRVEEGPFCGDGNLDPGEECDDGNSVNGDGCSDTCELEAGTYCGDGALQSPNDAGTGGPLNNGFEDCDDGANGDNTDGCYDNCTFTYCGDGITQNPNGNGNNEECDDGNSVNGDGCNINCLIEPGPECGNGMLDPGEDCDDGNNFNNDGCNANCQNEFCGDNILQQALGEECDDGANGNNLDGCDDNCNLTNINQICPEFNETNNINSANNTKNSGGGHAIGGGIGIIAKTEKFKPLIWADPRTRIVLEDCIEEGKVSSCNEELIERKNNYAFEGEQIHHDVLVMDKNGIEKVKDVYMTIDGKIEANCRFSDNKTDIDPRFVNARILEEAIDCFDPDIMQWYECVFTVETPESMKGQSWFSIAAEDLDDNIAYIDEKESWYFNPIISLEIKGRLDFGRVRPGTTSYSDSILIGNDADQGSGVLLDMFISGTDFYDPSSSGAKCPNTNKLGLTNFGYYAANGAYSTRTDARADNEGYISIGYGNAFLESFYGVNEILQEAPANGYFNANVLSPGSEFALAFRLNLPEPCYGDFSEGGIYFWGEAI